MIKSEIGHIIYEIANNEQLKGSDRMKLQRQLAVALHLTDKVEIELKPGIYQDGTECVNPPVFGGLQYWLQKHDALMHQCQQYFQENKWSVGHFTNEIK